MTFTQEEIDDEITKIVEDGALEETLTDLACRYYGIGRPRQPVMTIRRDLSMSAKQLTRKIQKLEKTIFLLMKRKMDGIS